MTGRRAGAALAALALVAAGPVALAPAASGAVGGPAAVDSGSDEPPLVAEQLVLSDLDSAGLPTRSVIVTRVVARDVPPRQLTIPMSSVDLEYVDRRGAPPLSGDSMVVDVGGPGQTSVTTQAAFDLPQPVALHAEYSQAGTVLDPATVPGRSGDLSIGYTVTNTVVEDRTLNYRDAAGERYETTSPVFAPFTGTLTVTLPPGAELVDAPDAVVGTTSDGSTWVRWSLVLAPPMGDYEQDRRLVLRGDDLQVPGVRLEAVPTTTDQDPAADFAGGLLKSSVEGSADLAEGLTTLDDSTVELATAAADLARGLDSLAEGADQLSAEVDDALVPGARQVAEGASELAAGQQEVAGAASSAQSGASDLATGADELANGLGDVSDGLQELVSAEGLPALAAGADQLATAVAAIAATVGSADDPRIELSSAGDATLVQVVRAVAAGTAQLQGVTAGISDGLREALTTLAQVTEDATAAAKAAGTAAALAQALIPQVCAPPAPVLPAPQCRQLAAIAEQSAAAQESATAAATGSGEGRAQVGRQAAAAAGVATALTDLVRALDGVAAGLVQVSGALRSGNPDDPGVYEGQVTLARSLQEVVQATLSLSAGAAQAEGGADDLAAGAADLSTGLGDLADGADALADGGRELASGAAAQAEGTAAVASGLNELDSGTTSAASGGTDLADGAWTLREDGTREVLGQVVDSSSDPALARAYLRAANRRAADAMPYGVPDDVVGRVAYVSVISPTSPPDRAAAATAALALVVLVSLGILAGRRLRRASDAPTQSGPDSPASPGD
ncbi:MAG: hypothetical protein R2737_01370 [Candidatus Nanopelagicales bacterium]